MGKMGRDNLRWAMRQPNLAATAVCDVYDRNRSWRWICERPNGHARAVHDFREILDDKSIDAVCIATPDHWHAYMTVEACKAGKDVYVEKPVATTIDEASERWWKPRANTIAWCRPGPCSGPPLHFQKAVELVRSGELGKVTFVRTWNYGHSNAGRDRQPAGFRSAARARLGSCGWAPRPARRFNSNRFGVDPEDRYFSRFRWFWDYAGGMMTDWGVHLIDIVQWAFE